MSKDKKLLEVVGDKIRLRHYSYQTEKAMLARLNAISFSIIKNTQKTWARLRLSSF
jgi:hypothetical protein